ncbi:MAG: 50S ribosomal protein L6 [Verrucomicrobia bacterium]|jgi:large subunit ribosomal protein L6|nr:50S ribosomal protein L6 [Verrucomicrobiota bacterium]
MSRIGRLPVAIPEKVEVSIEDGPQQSVTVKGPKGTLRQQFSTKAVRVRQEEGQVVVEPVGKDKFSRAMYGTARSLINGMIQGVTEGFTKKLTISGVGFRANVQGAILDLALGYSHPVRLEIPEGVTVTVEDQTKITVAGYDKQQVGQFAARIKWANPAEPYKGKGVAIEGEPVLRKEGKKAG